MSALRQPTPSADPPAVAALPATPRDVLDAIRENYTFVDSADEAVSLGILAHRPDVAAVLLDALPHVREIFGDGTQVMLISVDEHSGAPLRLSARIVTAESVEDARARRDIFFRSWWKEASNDVLGELSFGLIWPCGQ